jgi:hypothetical protein
LPALLGEKNRLNDTSPIPDYDFVAPIGTLFTGMIVRVTKFHFSPGTGMTGWMCRFSPAR